MTKRDGTRVGSDHAQCTILTRAFFCQGTFVFDGRGTIEVSGAFTDTVEDIAVTGGTGEFSGTEGQAVLRNQPNGNTLFIFELN